MIGLLLTLATITCGAQVCAGGTNAGSGPGVAGAASGGSGVAAITSGGRAAAVYGTASTGAGARGVSESGRGLEAVSTSSYGILGRTGSNEAAGIYGEARGAGSVGVLGVSAAGTGVLGFGSVALSGEGTASCPAGGCDASTNEIGVAALDITASGTAFQMLGSSGQTVFSIDDSGDLFFAGTLDCPNALGDVADFDGDYVVVCQSLGYGGNARAPSNALEDDALPRADAKTRSSISSISSMPAGSSAMLDSLAAASECISSQPCETVINTSSGTALEGQAEAGAAVEGISSSGAGVTGTGASGPGVYGASLAAAGLESSSQTSYALLGRTAASGAAGVWGDTVDKAAGAGVEGSAPNGVGVEGSGLVSFSGTGTITIRGTGGAPLLIVRDSKQEIVFSVDDSGNVLFTGALNCPAIAQDFPLFDEYCLPIGGYYYVSPYARRPERQDELTGDGHIRNGVGRVAFEHQIPRYSVSIEPEGDSAGALYVASQDANGFTVREDGGRSTLDFGFDVFPEARHR